MQDYIEDFVGVSGEQGFIVLFLRLSPSLHKRRRERRLIKTIGRQKCGNSSREANACLLLMIMKWAKKPKDNNVTDCRRLEYGSAAIECDKDRNLAKREAFRLPVARKSVSGVACPKRRRKALKPARFERKSPA